MNISQALNVWIIQAVVAIGPPLGALIFHVYIKTDWGISLFFLMPLALMAIPALRMRRIALLNLTASWLVISLVVLAASPWIVAYELSEKRTAGATYRARSELARELTEVWRTRFPSRWPVVAAYTDIGQPVTFYSPDHPAPLTPDEPWSSGLTSLDEAQALGLHRHLRNRRLEAGNMRGVDEGPCRQCRAHGDHHPPVLSGDAGPATTWNVYIVPPAK